MINAFTPINNFLDKSSSILGLISYGLNSKYAPFIDALGQFTPTITTSGGLKTFLSVKGLAKSGFGIIDAVKTLHNTPSVANAIAALDQASTAYDFILKLRLYNKQSTKGKLQQLLRYRFSYTIHEGETLSDISSKLGVPMDKIINDNNINNPNKINAGQQLKFSNEVYGREK